MNKQEVVDQILEGRPRDAGGAGEAYAPVNIALVKYWGKRDEELNLPVTSSLSISLDGHGARTRLTPADRDEIVVNGNRLAPDDPFATRAFSFIDLFRKGGAPALHVETESGVPIAAGLASSAAGFAALVRALDQLFGWELDLRLLSVLARLGSGSASRSVYEGFVEWHAGVSDDGADSFAEPLDVSWPPLRIGLLTLSDQQKPISSRLGMKRTMEASELYGSWPAKVANDLIDIKAAITARHFEKLGQIAESNALAMHATVISAWPPICYWTEATVRTLHNIWALRDNGLSLFFTMDAGPNVKLLFLEGDAEAVKADFPSVEVIAPFGDA